MMSLSHVCDAVHGQLIGSDIMAKNVSINTRSDCEGRLFVALKGDNFDAHDYVAQAKLAGAVAIMVERNVSSDLPMILVSSTHQALKDLAAWWRRQFAIPLIAITGSVGKTTVKEMLGAIAAEFGKGVVTKGNLNNEIGVPLTLMRLAPDDQYAIVEMGMNHAGEIERLSAIASPNVALVNNAAAAHLEDLGTIEAVAHAKGEIFSGLVDGGVAVINHDDPFADLWRDLARDHKVVTFGLSKQADVTASYEQDGGFLNMQVDALGVEASVRLNGMGEHTACNALAAIASALSANISMDVIVSGLENYQPVSGRLSPIRLNDYVLFDDTYNANPASMQAAINVLSAYDNNILVVGDMAELGASSEAEHLALGKFAATQGIDRLLACGRYASLVVQGFNTKTTRTAKAFEDKESLLASLLADPIVASALLVKGSRSAQMETVVAALKQASQEATSLSGESANRKTKKDDSHVARGVN